MTHTANQTDRTTLDKLAYERPALTPLGAVQHVIGVSIGTDSLPLDPTLSLFNSSLDDVF